MILSRVLPWLIVGLGAIYLTMMASAPARDSAGGMHLDEFGRLPVVHEGRLKPFDTLARNTLIHGGGNGVLTIAKGTLPLAIFGPAGYGLRQGLLSGPARIGQAAAPLVFGVALDRFGPDALIVTSLLGLSGYAAMLALGRSRKA